VLTNQNPTNMNRNTIKIILPILFIFFQFGCQNSKQDASNAIESKQNFNIVTTDVTFKSLSSSEQWEYIIGIVKTPYKSSEEVEKWLLKKWNANSFKVEALDEATLVKINEALYHSDYSIFAKKIALFTIYSNFGKTHTKAHATATAILLSEYNFHKQKDSLQFYVNFLKKVIAKDTTKWLKIKYYENKANLADLNGNFFDAGVNYHKAIKLTNPNDKSNLSILYQDLAVMYSNISYYDKAYDYFKKAVKLEGVDSIKINGQNIYGVIQYRSGDYKGAEQTYNNIIAKALKENSSGILAQTYSNFGNLKCRQNKFEEAINCFSASDSICKLLNIEIGFLINHINRSDVYRFQKNYTKALTELKKAEEIIVNYDNPKIKMELYQAISKNYDGQGEENLANKYFRKYATLKEDYLGDLPRSIISEWELANEIEIRNKQSSEFELSIQKQKNKYYLIAIAGTIICLLLVCFLFYYKFKKEKEKERIILEKNKISFELELKSKQLISESLNTISIQNTKDWINQELELIIQELPKIHQKKIINLSRNLKSNHVNQFLEEFETRFNGVYEEFFEKIKTIAPNLTSNELRICALMRLNISTKEMAMLTNRTIGTIENIRSTIRKKLYLEEKSNLQEFIINL
jgi:tetratricopeptide (TPR) repeat protein/DNA-binding CsgD family transcriptional regulator